MDDADACARMWKTEGAGLTLSRDTVAGGWGLPRFLAMSGVGIFAGDFLALEMRSMYVTGSLGAWFCSRVLKKPGEGGGASVCLRRLVVSDDFQKTFEGTLVVDILLRASDPLLCFLKEPRLINLEI